MGCFRFGLLCGYAHQFNFYTRSYELVLENLPVFVEYKESRVSNRKRNFTSHPTTIMLYYFAFGSERPIKLGFFTS